MKRFNFLNKALLSGVAVAGLTGAMLVAEPARAGSLGEDAAVGAGVGLGTGLFLGDDFGVDDAANGAAAGVACHVADEELRRGQDRSVVQDLAVGAVAAGGVGLITNNDSFLENAAQGAAACGVINILDGDRN
ncbi:MAG: hypothetical protein AAGC93_10345 [Cyanobacteria bacterium P01_F01_bin.53]